MARKIFIALQMATAAGREKLNGIFRYLHGRHDWDITFVRRAGDFTPERMNHAIALGFDGYIVSIPGTENTAKILADVDRPTIVMDIHDPHLQARKSNIVFIRNDPKEIGQAAAHELIHTGRCRSYAFIHNNLITEWSIDRVKAFRETLRDYGLWCHELEKPDGLKGLDYPIGILTANDDRGFDTLEYCRRASIRVPDKALVLGINNDTLICENCEPTLSSIQPDFEQEGFLAAQELDNLLQEAQPARHPAKTLFVGVHEIVRRQSTGLPSIAGILVQKALAYIRQNATHGIDVKDVARHLGCSRRLADLRFRELQHESIGACIIKTQLREAEQLLLSTDDSITVIAEKCGYSSASYLMTLFRKRYGITMREFRNRHKDDALNL